MADEITIDITETKNDSCDLKSNEAEEENKPLPRLRKPNMLKWLEIVVTEPERRTETSLKMMDSYTVYMVETRITDPSMKGYADDTTTVWRRYTEFELLRNYLDVIYPAIIVPPLPEKKATFTWQKSTTDKFEPDFIERRRHGLEIFLLRTAAHSILSNDRIFMAFLKKEEGWKELVGTTDFQSRADSKLKTINASWRVKNPNKKLEEAKTYSTELQSNITNILKTRARLCDKLYAVHKVHSNYARVFTEWSGMEKLMSDPLQNASHYMDLYASCIDGLLDEEEQYADQLKEYLGFGDSLRCVCRKHECLQYDLERLQVTLETKNTQREILTSGKGSGFTLNSVKTKLFGSDSPEHREEKIRQLDQQIKLTEMEQKQVTEEAQQFIEQALVDLERFKRQKAKDLREILLNYAVTQIKQCKKGIAVWTSTKDSFMKI